MSSDDNYLNDFDPSKLRKYLPLLRSKSQTGDAGLAQKYHNKIALALNDARKLRAETPESELKSYLARGLTPHQDPTVLMRPKKFQDLPQVGKHRQKRILRSLASNENPLADRYKDVNVVKHSNHYQLGDYKLTPVQTNEQPRLTTWEITHHDKPAGVIEVDKNNIVKWSQIYPAHKGIGRQVYQTIAKHHGGLSSDTLSTSPYAYNVWKGLERRGQAFKTDKVNSDGGPIYKIKFHNIKKAISNLGKLRKSFKDDDSITGISPDNLRWLKNKARDEK